MTEFRVPIFIDPTLHQHTPLAAEHGPANCTYCRSQARQFVASERLAAWGAGPEPAELTPGQWTVTLAVSSEEVTGWLNIGEDDPRFIRSPDSITPRELADYCHENFGLERQARYCSPAGEVTEL